MAQTLHSEVTSTTKPINFQDELYDSGHLMRDAFCGSIGNDIAVSDIVLAWLLRIPTNIDPSDAAKFILGCYTKDRAYNNVPKLFELVTMLQELTKYNASRLRQLSRLKRDKKFHKSNHISHELTLN